MSYPRFSRFNLVIRNQEILLATNTLSGATYRITEDMAKILEKGDVAALPDDVRQELESKGFILSSAEKDCELEKVEFIHHFEKFKCNWLNCTLLLTMGCNLRCVYCYEGAGKISNKSLTPQDYDQVYRFLTRRLLRDHLRGLSICLFGGEPWLQLQEARIFLGKIKSFCSQHQIKFQTSIVTNGTLVDEGGIELLRQVNCRSIQITLDGTKEVHDQRRIGPQGEGSFDDTLTGISKLAASQLPNPSIRINVDKSNLSSVRPLLRLLKERHLDHCNVNFGIVKGNTEHCCDYESCCFTQEELGDELEKLWAIAEEEGVRVYSSPSQKFSFCGMMGLQSFTIAPDLKVYKCWDFVNNPHHQIGRIDEEGNLVDLTPAFYRWMTRSPFNMAECQECPYIPVCGGGCGGMAGSDELTYRKACCFKIKGVFEKEVLARFAGVLHEGTKELQC